MARVAFQVALFGYLGLMNGALLSQLQLVGWAQAGVPRGAWGLVFLTAAALILPIATKRNLYCTHLCPHGALQQLTLHYARPRFKISRPWRCPVADSRQFVGLDRACRHDSLAVQPVHIEPFDAYVFRVAGWATLAIAVVGIIASLFVPMAYCRYGCPTGALLEYLRRNVRSDRLTGRDALAAGGVLAALVFWWVSGPMTR